MRGSDSKRKGCPVRGQSSVGWRHPATVLSRRDRSSVGRRQGGAPAGRRSAGLGSEGTARQMSHAVCVRARFRHTNAFPRSQKGQGVWRNGVCKTLVHTRWFVDAKIHFFGIRGKPLEVPPAPVVAGGMTMTVPRKGQKKGKDGRRREGVWQRHNIPRRPSFPLVSFGGAHHSASERSERAEPPPMTNALRRHSWKRLHRSATRCQPQQAPKPGRTAPPRDRYVPVGTTARWVAVEPRMRLIPRQGSISVIRGERAQGKSP